MGKYLINDTTLSAIGDAIRQIKGEEKYLKAVDYSHTYNIDDEGNKLSNYTLFTKSTDVVSLPGSENLHVTITYQMSIANSTFNYACIWEGDHPDYTAQANYSTSITGKLYPSAANQKFTKEFDIVGDTVTFGFYSSDFGDDSNAYGYYAVIEGDKGGGINPATSYLPSEMPQEIIDTVASMEPVVESINIIENGTYTPNEGIDGFNEVIVNVPDIPTVVESIVITKNGKYTPNEGVDGFNEIDVNVPDIPAVVEALVITANGTYTPSEGVDGFNPVTVNVAGGGGLSEEALNITGECQHRFSYGGWDWFIKDYGNQIITNKVDGADYMFYLSNVVSIPFDINMNTSKSYHNISCTFDSAQKLTNAPRIINAKPQNLNRLFYSCQNLREIPESFCDTWDWSYMEKQTGGYSCNKSSMISYCQSLRKFPMSLFSHANPQATTSYSQYASFAQHCYVLDEIVNLPIPYIATWTSNAFGYFCANAHRLKDLTFETNADGTPKVVNWKSQTIDLNQNVGQSTYNSSSSADSWNETSLNSAIGNSKITKYNSGITEDKAIYNAETYAALKDDPDAFCVNSKADGGGGRYSRYTHRSAVATINSLPDTSAYLASAGGTNTIKFLGNSGSATDEGAISDLTAEEIAVATAKGWTVTLI